MTSCTDYYAIFRSKCPYCGGYVEITKVIQGYGVEYYAKCVNCGREFYYDTRRAWEIGIPRICKDDP